jgi:hypothetical protein
VTSDPPPIEATNAAGVTVAPDDKRPRQSARSAAINPKSSLRDGFRRPTWVFSVKMRADPKAAVYRSHATASGSGASARRGSAR